VTNGGGVIITTTGNFSPIRVDSTDNTLSAEGGDADGGDGGNGGRVLVRTTGYDSDIIIDDPISVNGGDSQFGNGGNGGFDSGLDPFGSPRTTNAGAGDGVEISTSGVYSAITLGSGFLDAAPITANGGQVTENGLSGGDGGSVEILTGAEGGLINIGPGARAPISATGGNTDGRNGGDNGGAGGFVQIMTDNNSSVASSPILIGAEGQFYSPDASPINVSGGDVDRADYSDQNGGAGGVVFISTGDPTSDDDGDLNDSSFIRVYNNSNIFADGGFGQTGGDGGEILFSTNGNDSDVMIDSDLFARGGDSDEGGTGLLNFAGDGGLVEVMVDADGGVDPAGELAEGVDIWVDDIDVSGGESFGGAEGGTGGDGGSIRLHVDPDNDGDRGNVIVRGNLWADGGDTSSPFDTHFGGDGGSIYVQAASGQFIEPVHGLYSVPNGLLVIYDDWSAQGGEATIDRDDSVLNYGLGGMIELNPTNRLNANGFVVPGVATIIGAKPGFSPLTFDVTGRQPDGSVEEGPAGEHHVLGGVETIHGVISFGFDEKFTSVGSTFDNTGSVGSLLSTDGVPDGHFTDGDGDLLFRANAGLFRFSDVTIDGSIFVEGNTLTGDGPPDGVNGFESGVEFNNLLEHERQAVQFYRDVDNDGVDQDTITDTDDVRYDQGLDIVARDEIRFRGVALLTDPTETGNLNYDPQFALLDPDGFSLNLFFRGYEIRILPNFDELFADTSADLPGNINEPIHGPGTGPAVLDHMADGPSINDVAPGVPSDLSDMIDVWYERFPHDENWDVVDPQTYPTAAMLDQLQEMGVYARPYREDELVGQLTTNFLDDAPQTLDPQPQDYTVVERRIDYHDAERVLELFDQLNNKDVVTAEDLSAIGVQLQQMGLTRREIRGSLEALISLFNANVTVDQVMPVERDLAMMADEDAASDSEDAQQGEDASE
jgi:hypothetical protein